MRGKQKNEAQIERQSVLLDRDYRGHLGDVLYDTHVRANRNQN
jgi:hypothetical protein